MRVVILGCGRTGACLAQRLVSEGHQVTIIDSNRASFAVLGSDFPGKLVAGTGIDEDVLQSAGINQADAFIAVTNQDNTNLMAAQVVKNAFKVARVICRVDDPLLEEIYRDLGLETICHTQWEVAQVESCLAKK